VRGSSKATKSSISSGARFMFMSCDLYRCSQLHARWHVMCTLLSRFLLSSSSLLVRIDGRVVHSSLYEFFFSAFSPFLFSCDSIYWFSWGANLILLVHVQRQCSGVRGLTFDRI
jgi:hypothetical protein